MQKDLILQTIQAILDEGGDAGIRAVTDCRVRSKSAGFLNTSGARVQAVQGFAIAMHDCFETLQKFLIDSRATQDATIIREARQKVVSFVRTHVNSHSTSFLEEPLSRSAGSGATYSEEDQILDKIEAQADIMFHQALAGTGRGMPRAAEIGT